VPHDLETREARKGERHIKTVLLHGAKNGSSLGYVGISALAGIS
jgi:hypothetical protein